MHYRVTHLHTHRWASQGEWVSEWDQYINWVRKHDSPEDKKVNATFSRSERYILPEDGHLAGFAQCAANKWILAKHEVVDWLSTIRVLQQSPSGPTNNGGNSRLRLLSHIDDVVLCSPFLVVTPSLTGSGAVLCRLAQVQAVNWEVPWGPGATLLARGLGWERRE